MWYWVKTNWFIKRLFPKYVWNIPNKENTIYLTFDDGPTPEITSWVLSVLAEYNAKATFFCIGKNIKNHPEIVQDSIKNGHKIGNHTFHHLNGWKTTADDYLKDVMACELLISGDKEKLFRPPYGKIKPSQSIKLRKMGYKIIMWEVLSADFNTEISKEKCLNNVLENAVSGSIVVFHDSQKAFENLEYVLPRALQYWSQKGYVFKTIP